MLQRFSLFADGIGFGVGLQTFQQKYKIIKFLKKEYLYIK